MYLSQLHAWCCCAFLLFFFFIPFALPRWGAIYWEVVIAAMERGSFIGGRDRGDIVGVVCALGCTMVNGNLKLHLGAELASMNREGVRAFYWILECFSCNFVRENKCKLRSEKYLRGRCHCDKLHGRRWISNSFTHSLRQAKNQAHCVTYQELPGITTVYSDFSFRYYSLRRKIVLFDGINSMRSAT